MSMFLDPSNYPMEHCASASAEVSEKYNRNFEEDFKKGIDLIFELKEKMELMHPGARQLLIRMLNY